MSRAIPDPDVERWDVVVVGSGGAGMSAAVTAADAGARVVIVTKAALGASNTGRAQGGIQAAVAAGDSPAAHFEDTFAAGHGDADRALVRRLTEDGPEAIGWLARLGVPFSTEDGRMRVIRCGGARTARLLQAGERTGAEMVKALRAAVRARPITVLESTRVKAIVRDGDDWLLRCDGDGPRMLRAPAVVLAAGGGMRGEAEHLGVGSTNHPDATPEILRLALDLGAEGVHLDSWQRHPTGSVWPEALSGYALPETTRSYGATLHDAVGDRFVDELAPRDVVANAITATLDAGRGVPAPDGRLGVWLDTPAIDRIHGAGFTAERLAYVTNRYRKAGVDITRERVLVAPVLHYRNGGLRIGENAETTLPGIFAAGEIAGGVHGTNRLMGNSLLDTVVFGRIAGRAAAELRSAT